MAVAAISRRSVVARSPILAASCASGAVRINPACVATPEDAKRHRHRPRDEGSPQAKRRRRDDDAHRVSSADRKRKRDSDSVRASRGDDGRRGSYSRDSCTRMSHSRRNFKNREDERAQEARRRSRSGNSPPSEPKTRPVSCASQAQPQLPAATVETPRVAALDDNQPLQDLTEQFEEPEWRRRETQRKREEARREMDKVVQTVYFDDPFVSLKDILKR